MKMIFNRSFQIWLIERVTSFLLAKQSDEIYMNICR